MEHAKGNGIGDQREILPILDAAHRIKPGEESGKCFWRGEELVCRNSRTVDEWATVSPSIRIKNPDLLWRPSSFEDLRDVTAVTGTQLLPSIVPQIECRAQPRTECSVIRDEPSASVSRVVAVVTQTEIERPAAAEVPSVIEVRAGGTQVAAAVPWIMVRPDDERGWTKKRISIRPDDPCRTGLNV